MLTCQYSVLRVKHAMLQCRDAAPDVDTRLGASATRCGTMMPFPVALAWVEHRYLRWLVGLRPLVVLRHLLLARATGRLGVLRVATCARL